MICPNCGFIDRSHWRQNRWRTNVDFLKFRDYPEDIDPKIVERLQAGHVVALDKLHAYRKSGDNIIERVLRVDYEAGGMSAFHIPREHINHKKDPWQTKILKG